MFLSFIETKQWWGLGERGFSELKDSFLCTCSTCTELRFPLFAFIISSYMWLRPEGEAK